MTGVEQKRMVVTTETKNIRRVVSGLIQFVKEKVGIDSDMLSLVLTEAVTNAMLHGNRDQSSKKVWVEARVKDDRVILKVKDEGPGFNYDDVPDPTMDENLMRHSGRGLYLIRALMDEVTFNKNGNEIAMVKYLD